jgi:hypothetical protein
MLIASEDLGIFKKIIFTILFFSIDKTNIFDKLCITNSKRIFSFQRGVADVKGPLNFSF